MKTTSFVASILSLAVAATAAPTVEVHNTGSTCLANTKQVCCNGLLNCVVQALSSTCTGDVYCCNTDAPEASVISLCYSNTAEQLTTIRKPWSMLPFSTVLTSSKASPGIYAVVHAVTTMPSMRVCASSKWSLVLNTGSRRAWQWRSSRGLLLDLADLYNACLSHSFAGSVAGF